MKALILAGGRGTRLRPLTHTSAKQLIPIANKPTIFYGIEAIVASGITEIGVIVGHTKNDICAALGDGSQFGATFTFIEQDAPKGLAHAVMIAEEFMAGESFLMYLGDNIVRSGVSSFVQEFQTKQPNAMVLLNTVPNPQQYGVVELLDGKIRQLVEKPKEPNSNLALVGVYLFDHHIFQAVKSIRPSWRNELEITDAIQWLVDQDLQVDPHIIDDWWKDTGRPEDILEANRIILERLVTKMDGHLTSDCHVSGRIEVGRGTIIENSTLRGPVIIGSNTRIKDSYIGPFTAIGNNANICEAEIENSILLDDVTLSHIPVRIDNSLLGRGVQVSARERRPKAISLVLGDCSAVEL